MHKCNDCDHEQYIYYSCRNRHCPSCQGAKREQWVAKQQEYLLDVPYYHVVFTIPSELHGLCLYRPKHLYALLMRASWQTIDTLSKDKKYLGAHTGMTAVLHTWSQNMLLHPHVHCIVPGGGLSKSGYWITTRSHGKYLYPIKVMCILFRAIFMKGLKELAKAGVINIDIHLRKKLYAKRWVVYAKRPFAKPAHVIEYLGRYTHKVAISNYRITHVDEKQVTFKWKDYRHGAVKKDMTLPIHEFIRRFALHILPHKFVRIRHYGILSNHGRSKVIPLIQQQQNCKPIIDIVVNRNNDEPISCCPKCKGHNLTSTILPKIKTRAP